ncbi:ABC transporter ATP-binding protein [Parvicella tangerina]|uniref:Ferric enterobactin transport ATP-binding protein FepC n=1 Tax=Parvicella tangerina TaxID=2829795 RepID=A0A916JK32_9FLAO|nr:ABC transporter ATP-binding protein [Parvicella tangerina]CAG5077813.1 Ferric enterobactin transport ATP-binding protein FepC [Parvicella tangerina]
MNKKSTILEVEDLIIGYKNKELVRSINVSGSAGQFILLVGANGKGKSTLLKTLMGHLAPIAGKVRLKGEDLADLSLTTIAQTVAFLSGNTHLPSSVTVNDLLQFSRIPYQSGVRGIRAEDRKVIRQVVDEMGIDDFLEKPYMSLSDGQKQLINIARSLVQQTPIILLDEPTAHLDVVNKRTVFQLLKDQTEKGKLIVCCSHDLAEGSLFADEVWLINKADNFEVVEMYKEITTSDLESRLF